MDVQKMVKTLKDLAVGDTFLKAIYDEYDADPRGDYTDTEEDYREAIHALAGISSRQMALLHEEEKRYAENRIYAARYGFSCGIFAGFRQLFDDRAKGNEDFFELVEKGLFTIPGMERHRSYIENQTRCNAIYDELNEALGKSQEENLVSIDCAWGERVHHAAYMAFYLGYRVALDIIRNVSFHLELEMTPKQLLTEYSLGFIGTYDQIRSQAMRPVAIAQKAN